MIETTAPLASSATVLSLGQTRAKSSQKASGTVDWLKRFSPFLKGDPLAIYRKVFWRRWCIGYACEAVTSGNARLQPL